MKKDVSIILVVVLMIVVIGLQLIRLQPFPSEAPFPETTVNLSISETCLQCHAETTGYSEHHNPELIGCVACHLGNGEDPIKERSHLGMIRIPGNLNDAAHTCGKCHADALEKINKSLMTTNSGLIGVDKYVFGERETPDDAFHINLLENSAADMHLRDLCANCHLGAEKKTYGKIDELSRGGGCNACHLNYSKKASEALIAYLESSKTVLPKFHPSTDIQLTNTHCYGCHSRSSRISTNYEGFQETVLDEIPEQSDSRYKKHQDKRIYKYINEDVHHKAGLLCIDCHSSHEVMGDGNSYKHAEDAVHITCSDCHFKTSPNTVVFDSLDIESVRVFNLRNFDHREHKMLKVKKSGHPLVNTYVDSLGTPYLIGKKDGAMHKISLQPETCSRDEAHQHLACATCHSSWTTKCIGCHNEYDSEATMSFDLLERNYKTGQWKEYIAEFEATLPSLGVKMEDGIRKVIPTIPGMILTIDKGSYEGKPVGSDMDFHRLYAPNSPHTTVNKSRSCTSCHLNPFALGFGAGKLHYITENGTGRWKFEPRYASNQHDGLPEDAWIGFLKNPEQDVKNSTRTNLRPFSLEEQQKLLLVGACLTCHNENSDVMKQSLKTGISELLLLKSVQCILPE